MAEYLVNILERGKGFIQEMVGHSVKRPDPLTGVFSDAAVAWLKSKHDCGPVDLVNCTLFSGLFPEEILKQFDVAEEDFSTRKHMLVAIYKADENIAVGRTRGAIVYSQIDDISVIYEVESIENEGQLERSITRFKVVGDEVYPDEIQVGDENFLVYEKTLGLFEDSNLSITPTWSWNCISCPAKEHCPPGTVG